MCHTILSWIDRHFNKNTSVSSKAFIKIILANDADRGDPIENGSLDSVK